MGYQYGCAERVTKFAYGFDGKRGKAESTWSTAERANRDVERRYLAPGFYCGSFDGIQLTRRNIVSGCDSAEREVKVAQRH